RPEQQGRGAQVCLVAIGHRQGREDHGGGQDRDTEPVEACRVLARPRILDERPGRVLLVLEQRLHSRLGRVAAFGRRRDGLDLGSAQQAVELLQVAAADATRRWGSLGGREVYGHTGGRVEPQTPLVADGEQDVTLDALGYAHTPALACVGRRQGRLGAWSRTGRPHAEEGWCRRRPRAQVQVAAVDLDVAAGERPKRRWVWFALDDDVRGRACGRGDGVLLAGIVVDRPLDVVLLGERERPEDVPAASDLEQPGDQV